MAASNAVIGDSDNNLLRKIADNTALLGGGGSGAASNVAVTSSVLPNGAATQATLAAVLAALASIPVTGPLTDAQLRASAVPISAASLPLPTGASTEATLALLNGKVTACNTGAVVVSSSALPTGASTEATLSSLNGKVTACNTGAVVLAAGAAAIGSVSVTGNVTVVQGTGTNLKVDISGTGANATAVKVDGSAVTQPISGNVGGKTTAIKDTTAVSTTPAYTSGDAVGAKRTLTNVFLSSGGTAILESITVLDRANQAAALEIIFFDSDPTNATITDNAAFVYSTDDLKVLGRVSVAASDYVTLNSKAIATLKGIGLTLKGNATTSLFVAVVTTGTPTYAATTDVQITFGFLQDN
jgi:hypothetical protein